MDCFIRPSIIATAVTTILSSVVMLFTVITFFRKFAMILFITTVMASVGSFIFLATFLDCSGPSNPTYLADKCMEVCCKSKNVNGGVLETNESDISKKGHTSRMSSSMFELDKSERSSIS